MTPTPRRSVVNRILAWSFSRFQTYSQCAARAKYLYIDKMKEPDSPAGAKGTRVHAIAAVVASGELPKQNRENAALMPELVKILASKKIPVELETFKKEFAALKKIDVMVESEWAFNKDWELTGWFDADAWLRIKVDLHYLTVKKIGRVNQTTVHIRDHKTGKIKDDHKFQRSLYALGALMVYPDAEKVVVSHWYLDPGEESKPETWSRMDLYDLQKEWLRRTEAMLNDTTFAPSPGQHCHWCIASKAKGGPCKF